MRDDDEREQREWGSEPTSDEDLARLSTDGGEAVMLDVARQLAAAGQLDQSPHADYYRKLLAKYGENGESQEFAEWPVVALSGHPPGYNAQPHVEHGHWGPGQGSEHEGEGGGAGSGKSEGQLRAASRAAREAARKAFHRQSEAPFGSAEHAALHAKFEAADAASRAAHQRLIDFLRPGAHARAEQEAEQRAQLERQAREEMARRYSIAKARGESDDPTNGS